MMMAESVVLIGTGVIFGTIASLLTIVPFTIARTNSIVPDGGITRYLGVIATATLIALITSAVATRRTIRTPAIEAVSA
jgi:putative ABC transport system permease protein